MGQPYRCVWLTTQVMHLSVCAHFVHVHSTAIDDHTNSCAYKLMHCTIITIATADPTVM